MTTNRKPLQKYNPGSLDETDTESLKMGVVEELWEISTNFMQTDEILGDAFEKIEELEIDRDGINAQITEITRLSVEGDKALAEKITKLSADIDSGDSNLSSKIEETNRVVSDLEKTTAENKLELGSSISSVKNEAKSDLEKAEKDLADAIARGDEEEAERLRAEIGRLQGIIDANKADIEAKLKVTNTTLAGLDKAMAENKLELEASIKGVGDSASAADKEAADKADKALKEAQAALDKAIKDGDTDAAKKLQAEVDRLTGVINSNKTDIEAKLTVTNTTVATLEKSTTSQITNLQSDYNGKFSNVNQTLSTHTDKLGKVEAKWGVTVDANGTVGGVQLISGASGRSEFKVNADVFSITNGSQTVKPVTIEGGKATFNNIIARGHIEASSGSFTGTVTATNGVFDNVTINKTCRFLGTIDSTQINDTAVTAANKMSATGPGISPNPNHTLVSDMVVGNVLNARPYNRVLYVAYPGIVSTTAEGGGGSTQKQLRVTVQLLYRGAVVSEIVIKDYRPNQPGSGFDFTSSIAGIIPANTTGEYRLRVTCFAQDRYPSINYTAQVCLAAIYKTSNEIN